MMRSPAPPIWPSRRTGRADRGAACSPASFTSPRAPACPSCRWASPTAEPGACPAGTASPCPAPGATSSCVTTEPIHVPPDVRKDQLEVWRLRVEDAIRQADEAAERMLRTRPCIEGKRRGTEGRLTPVNSSCNGIGRWLLSPLHRKTRNPKLLEARPAMSLWVRGMLVGIALGLTALFAVAAWLNPTRTTAPRGAWKRTGSWDCPSARSNESPAILVRRAA